MSMETTRMIRKRMPVSALFDPKIVMPAIGSAFVKLDPRTLIKNPVMFVLETVAALATIILVRDLVTGGQTLLFEFQIVVWLWFTVLFANFAEAVAEGRGKAQADALRRQRTETQATLLSDSASKDLRLVASPSLQIGDVVLVEPGHMIPSDGEVIEAGSEALDAPGYDLMALITGSEGNLGVITRVVVRLVPLPERTETLLAAFPSVRQAAEAVSAIIASPPSPRSR